MAAYQVVTAADKRQLSDFLIREGQFLIPIVKLIEQSELAIEQVVDVTGRACIEAVLEMSAREVAGSKSPGKASGDVRWHGSQDGLAHMGDRKLRVRRPRLRHKTVEGKPSYEVPVPAYEAMQTGGKLASRMMSILLDGVSTRKYKRVIPEMAETVGVSKSAVSRANVEAGEKLLEELAERRFDDLDLLIIYLDGIRLGSHHILGAVGVDPTGQKHVLGLRQGSSENTTVVTELLNDLVRRGLAPARRRLFVIDGSKALRAAIDAVFGANNPVQRCRAHKLRNVVDHLPKDQHANAKSTLRAAWKLPAERGKRQIEQLARWYEKKHPSASASLLEGLDELFTINAMDLPPKLQRCLATTNIIESTNGGVRQRINRVKNWQDGSMALRWASAAFEATASNFRRIMGHQQLWMLKAYLEQSPTEEKVGAAKKVG
jgi:transposase-like protein